MPTSSNSDSIRQLIDKICEYSPETPQRQKYLNHLLLKIKNLPGILKSNHQDYPQALNFTWEWFCREICNFKETPPSIETSLVKWINGYLKWRITDLTHLTHNGTTDSPPDGFLPLPPQNLEQSFDRWISNYRSTELINLSNSQKAYRIRVKEVRSNSTENNTQEIKTNLNRWLNSGDEKWRVIRDSLIALGAKKNDNEEVAFLLELPNLKWGRIPWQE